MVINFAKKTTQDIDVAPKFKNIFTTPYLNDLDGDGYLDLVYGQYYSATTDIILFFGMKVKRVSTSIKLREKVLWDGYMGNEGAGIFTGF